MRGPLMRLVLAFFFIFGVAFSTPIFEDVLLRANSGDTESQKILGDLYAKDKNFTQAIKWYESAAEKGDSRAQFALGQLYYGYPRYKEIKDYEKSIYWLGLFSESGSWIAPELIGDLYALEEDGKRPDYQKAIYWYQIASDRDNYDADFKIGEIYYLGRAGNVNYEEALKRFRRVLEQSSDPDSMVLMYLGDMYFFGKGVNIDYQKAMGYYVQASKRNSYPFHWLEKSGEYSSYISQKIGDFYYYGLGIEIDYFKAKSQYEWALWQNDKNSEVLFQLGQMYINGFGVRQDNDLAKEYFGKACDNGNQEGCSAYKELHLNVN